MTDVLSVQLSICAKVTLAAPLTVAQRCVRSDTAKNEPSSTTSAAAANRSPHAPVQHIIRLGHRDPQLPSLSNDTSADRDPLREPERTERQHEDVTCGRGKHESRNVLNNTRHASARQPSGSAHPVSRMAVPDLRREAAGDSLGRWAGCGSAIRAGHGALRAYVPQLAVVVGSVVQASFPCGYELSKSRDQRCRRGTEAARPTADSSRACRVRPPGPVRRRRGLVFKSG